MFGFMYPATCMVCMVSYDITTIHILGDTHRVPEWAPQRLVLSTPLTLFAWLHAWVRPSVVHVGGCLVTHAAFTI